jgi:hypothetical protein
MNNLEHTRTLTDILVSSEMHTDGLSDELIELLFDTHAEGDSCFWCPEYHEYPGHFVRQSRVEH